MSTLVDAFAWPKKTLKCLAKELEPEVLQKSVLVNGSTISTYFSGVGTPELALQTLEKNKVKNLSVANFEAVSACDWDAGCRNVLMNADNGLVYGDILERLPPKVRNSAALKSSKFEKKKKAILRKSCSTRNPATTYSKDENGKIVKGKAICPVAGVDMSGSPCTDWSPIGLRKGEAGHTAAIYLTWGKIQLDNETPVLIHENVRKFPVEKLEEVLGHKYDIYSIETQPSDIGFGLLRRARRYDVLVHKKRAEVMADIPKMYAAVQKAVGDDAKGPWKRLDSFMLASKKELLEEEQHVAKSRGKQCKDSSKSAKGLDWEYLLLPREKEAVRVFTKKWIQNSNTKKHPTEDPNCIFHIGDNPNMRCVWSANGYIPTFRRGGGKYWMPYHRRWILPKERLALMGFPVYPDLAKASGVDLMEIENNQQAKMMAGNAMHLGNAGAILAVALACVQIKDVNKTDSKKRKFADMCTPNKRRRV